MNTEQYQQAANLYKAGDKEGAEKILLVMIEQEPDSAELWFALSRCSKSDQEHIERLEKCLEFNPEFEKAKNDIEIFRKRQKAQEAVPPIIPSNTKKQDERDVEMLEDGPKQATPTRSAFPIIASPIILILIAVLIWQFIRLDRLNKSINNLEVHVNSMASDLSYVSSLAENANRYAHTHGYSDERLKTNIRGIDHPLDKALMLQGVYFEWNTAEYPEMGFSDGTQIGVVAQEVEEVFPELVTTDEDGFKHVNYEALSAVLIEATKEQQQQIDELSNRVNQLEKQ